MVESVFLFARSSSKKLGKLIYDEVLRKRLLDEQYARLPYIILIIALSVWLVLKQFFSRLPFCWEIVENIPKYEKTNSLTFVHHIFPLDLAHTFIRRPLWQRLWLFLDNYIINSKHRVFSIFFNQRTHWFSWHYVRFLEKSWIFPTWFWSWFGYPSLPYGEWPKIFKFSHKTKAPPESFAFFFGWHFPSLEHWSYMSLADLHQLIVFFAGMITHPQISRRFWPTFG